MKIRILLILAITIGSQATVATGAGFFLKFGPTSLGNGGSNPLGVPPGPTDLELSIITNGGFETNIGLPGLLCGIRAQKSWGGYVSFGGGIVVDANGGGPGAYSAFGYDTPGKNLKANFEFKQAWGISEGGTLNPYAVRFGIGYWFR